MSAKRTALTSLATALLGASSLALSPAAHAALPSNCTLDADGNGWVCVNVSTKASNFTAAWSRVLDNTASTSPTSFSCTATSSTTWKWSVNVSSTVEAGVIFAKADITVGGALEYSTTTARSSSATFNVAARQKALCQDGAAIYTITGTYTHTRCGSSACINTSASYRLSAPSYETWKITNPY